MNIEDFREYCLSKSEVTESFPFDDKTLVFKVCDKMFALTSVEGDFRINLKCCPYEVEERREKYSAVIPGYHMNKKHWNTVIVDGSISDDLIKQWTDESYNLVIKKLPLKLRNKLI